MAKDRSEASRFRSRTGGWVTAAQWLAEEMTFREAARAGVQLGKGFWKKVRWLGVFRRELTIANRLLARYDRTALGRLLRTKEGRAAHTLGAGWLEPALAREAEKLVRERAAMAAAPVRTEGPGAPPAEVTGPYRPPEPFVARPSLLERLRKLDGEVEGED